MEQARYIEVLAGVRYWEDARVNGETDTDGSRIPLRSGDDWHPTIELATGRILDWPAGVAAQTCYKVCESGDYWLLDAERKRIAKWKDYYVPAAMFDRSHWGVASDYVVLLIGADGVIKDWQTPHLEPEQWGIV
jgi:hypothetical protein